MPKTTKAPSTPAVTAPRSRTPHELRVADLMTSHVKTVRHDATIGQAVEYIADAHVSAVPVVDGHEKMIGVLSVSDILEAEAEADRRGGRTVVFDETMVSEVMTPRPLVVSPETTARDAAREMLYADVHRLFAEDADGKLVGVISQTDLVRAIATGKL